MATYRSSRVLPIVLVIVVIVIAITALVSLARVVFFSGSSSSNDTARVDTSQASLLNTSAGHSVNMTVRGPIVAEEKFQSYSITITPNDRSLVTYGGYLDTVVDRVVLGNNTAAYEQFVYALDRANLAKGEETERSNDVRGICATGNVYEFSIINAGETVKRLWTSTCNGSKGTLDANVQQLTNLFVSQFPNGTALIRKINL